MNIPREVFDMEDEGVRFAKREKIFFPVEVYGLGQTSKSRNVIKGYIIDISNTGALIYGGLSHLLDQDIVISFKVSWLAETFRLKAKVVRCDISSVGITCGIKLFDLREVDLEAIENLIRFVEQKNFQNII